MLEKKTVDYIQITQFASIAFLQVIITIALH